MKFLYVRDIGLREPPPKLESGDVTEYVLGIESAKFLIDIFEYDVVLFHCAGQCCKRMLTCMGNKAQKSMAIVFLSSSLSSEDVISVLSAGATDCLKYPMNSRELAARLNAISRRAMGVRESVIRVGSIKIDTARKAIWSNKSEIKLTNAEFAVLESLALRPNRAATRSQLQDLISLSDVSASERVIDVLVCKVRKKIQMYSPNANLIETVRGTGYKFIS